MPQRISDEHLQRYLAGSLSQTAKRRLDAAMQKSLALRRRLEELQREAELLDAIKDARVIRLSQRDEERVPSRVMAGGP